jgi:hypothetical protein
MGSATHRVNAENIEIREAKMSESKERESGKNLHGCRVGLKDEK